MRTKGLSNRLNKIEATQAAWEADMRRQLADYLRAQPADDQAAFWRAWIQHWGSAVERAEIAAVYGSVASADDRAVLQRIIDTFFGGRGWRAPQLDPDPMPAPALELA